MSLTPKTQIQNIKILFDKSETHASPPMTSLRKFKYVKKGEACALHQKTQIQNIENCFIKVRYVPHL